MFNTDDVAIVRHVVQRILVPCVFVIGLLGNTVSIYVLTRRRMRCTTNIYLTALALTDIIYLTMALLLSLKHYEYMQSSCEYYWMFYGTFIWLCDACAYISIYIAVCFTIERFIAIRYPLKRQTFCTESLAKKVISGVALFCLLSTISTAFEHKYSSEYKLIDIRTGEQCNFTQANASNKTLTDYLDLRQGSGNGPLELTPQKTNTLQASQYNDNIMRPTVESIRHSVAYSASSDIPNIPILPQDSAKNIFDAEFLISEANMRDLHMQMRRHIDEANDVEWIFTFNVTEFCENVTYYHNDMSNLATNELYKSIWYYFSTLVFVLIPLCVLLTFNSFLIMLVRKSKSLRGDLTNASSMRKTKRKSQTTTVSQENRVTVTLIAVVLLFIICQLPWAIYLITSEHIEIEPNLQAIFGNIFNFLAAINAAANFFLYCVLSDKYRKTVRELITGNKYQLNRHTLTSASSYANAVTNGSRRYRTSASAIIK